MRNVLPPIFLVFPIRCVSFATRNIATHRVDGRGRGFDEWTRGLGVAEVGGEESESMNRARLSFVARAIGRTRWKTIQPDC